MRHFLHSFRAIWISATIIALIELSCWIFARPQQLAASNFLELAYLKKENTSKVYIQARTQLTLGLHPAIVQVGDSSGMHGVMPVVLDKYLDGLRYVNDGFAGDVGYFGHFDVAKTVLNHSNSVKAVVFYVTPLAKPAFYGDAARTLERSIYSSFIGPWNGFVTPTMGHRIGVTNLVYYGELNDQIPHGITGFFGNIDLRESFLTQRGFFPREMAFPERDPLPTGECSFAPWFTPLPDGQKAFDYFYAGLEKMAELARARNIRLMVVFNPVPCHEGKNVGTLTIKRELARFRKDYPDVVIPFPFITTWPPERFIDSWHFISWAAKINSERLGPEVARMMKDPKFTGVQPQSVGELDAELAKARHEVERPASCEEPARTDTEAVKNGVFTNCIGLRFVTLPAGRFIMGSCGSETDCPTGAIPDIAARREEMSAHPVVVKEPFQMTETPITIAQFQKFLDSPQATNDDEKTDYLSIDKPFLAVNLSGGDQRPVTMVTWENAVAFARWLNKIKPASDKGTYRLPSEAEWEYAARSGSQAAFWWGADPGVDMANCLGCTVRFGGKIAPVAWFMPNLFGLYDMNGNVWGWTEDCYRGWYGSGEADSRAYEQPECTSRSLRGGGADMPGPYWSRAASRFSDTPTSRSDTIGFRVVRDVDPSDPSAVPVQPAHIVSDGQPLASSDNSGSPAKAFDNDKATFWLSAEHGAQIKDHAWIGYKFAKPMKVGWIRIDQTNNPPFREDLVRVESSNDGETWTPALPEPVHLVGTTDWIYLPSSSPASMWRVVAADDSTPPRDTWAVIELGFYVRDGDIHAGNSR